MSETSGKAANFCGSCGTAIHGANFCSECGTPSGVHQAITPAMAAAALREPETARFDRPEPAEEPVKPTPPPKKRGTGTWVAIGGSVAALAVVAIVAVVVLTSSDGSPEQAAHRRSGPGLPTAGRGDVRAGARRQPAGLQPTRGPERHEAQQRAARRPAGAAGVRPRRVGRCARCRCRRARSASPAPRSRRWTVRSPYLAGVAAVLSHPTVAGASQMQTLSSNLISGADTRPARPWPASSRRSAAPIA